ncbi:efflux RND transporter periplasmic adaptor subunit [Pseudomonas koreensis]|uniref:efflux RND transporter periplasmic adaptor subunit n=1 Tax=Pseudomonas koreensis TaxID=198620 RepID=UPI001B33574B|nr:efflux RND transporter periplasmic adaptor subunit [Pseudomonas koreensis]MBP4001602.1 efflux RND transporter periplasmic adaptor subunit [Pseudomonas koreensis]
MTMSLSRKGWWSAVILVLGTDAGLAAAAINTHPEHTVWPRARGGDLLANISLRSDPVTAMSSAPTAVGASETNTPSPETSPPTAPFSPPATEPQAPSGKEPVPVPDAPIIEPPMVPDKRLAAGVVRSQDQATLASRMTALITLMPLQAGQSFKQGETLIAFDCSQLYAQLKAAEAAVEAYKTTYDTNVELDHYKAIGINEVRVSRANVNKAAAEAAALRATTSQCQIDAPFDGSVVERKANPHDVAASGQPLMKIQSNGTYEVELIVPSAWLVWLELGSRFNFRLEETGNTVEGRVTRLGVTVDPVSKTLRIVGEIASKGKILPGMSGTANFDVAQRTPTDESLDAERA